VKGVPNYPCLERLAARTYGHWVRSYPGIAQQGVVPVHRQARLLLYLSAMSSSKRNKRSRGVVDRSATTDVVSQLECAIRNPQAALIGALIGGLVPWFGRTLAHEEIPSAWSSNHSLALAMIAVVLGCACFSALSVYKFGRAAFGDARKAIGFVLALEGVMLVSHGATSTVALAVLILINAVANGSVIALSRDATRRRCEADARRATTRARTRAEARAPRHAGAVPSPRSVPVSAVKTRVARTASGRALVAPVWRRATLDDVIDAEIVSEERLPS
jgi:hypothetical protein